MRIIRMQNIVDPSCKSESFIKLTKIKKHKHLMIIERC